jgi:hypothetical protein
MDTIMFRLGLPSRRPSMSPAGRRGHPLARDLDVLRTAVKDGRWTFVNTPKY